LAANVANAAALHAIDAVEPQKARKSLVMSNDD